MRIGLPGRPVPHGRRSLQHDSPTVQALREIEYQLRRIGRNVNQIAHNANREMNATIEDEALRLSREQA